MKLVTNIKKYENDLQDVVNLFYPVETQGDIILEASNNAIEIDGHYECQFDLASEDGKTIKKTLKNALYNYLVKITKRKMPWGSLTGIRPTKIVRDYMKSGLSLDQASIKLIEDYGVQADKANLAKTIIAEQNHLCKNTSKMIDFYVHIPICPSKCYYCSFPSSQLCHVQRLIPRYVECVCAEIDACLKFLSKRSIVIKSLYIGGGTPTVLSDEQLDVLMSKFDGYKIDEIVVECGRPDTIDEKKLSVLKSHNVTRISINPQTFSDKTLKLIGRNHTTKQTLQAFELAQKFGFSINMDFIAGLKNESYFMFKKSLKKAIALSPDNITVHTLAIKRGSILNNQTKPEKFANRVEKMIDFSQKILSKSGYIPYYMYRQKAMLCNLENVGYSKIGNLCKFNIDTMEEISNIIACGAGGISKMIYHDSGRIERQANVKGIEEYIARLDEMVEKKLILFDNL